MIICLPLNLFKNEMLQCGCSRPVINGEVAYIVKDINPKEKRLRVGDSALIYCGDCLTKNYPEFKDVKSK